MALFVRVEQISRHHKDGWVPIEGEITIFTEPPKNPKHRSVFDDGIVYRLSVIDEWIVKKFGLKNPYSVLASYSIRGYPDKAGGDFDGQPVGIPVHKEFTTGLRITVSPNVLE